MINNLGWRLYLIYQSYYSFDLVKVVQHTYKFEIHTIVIFSIVNGNKSIHKTVTTL